MGERACYRIAAYPGANTTAGLIRGMMPSNSSEMPDAKAEMTVALAVVAAAALVLFFTSALDGDFWWSDAPRHALNGIFLKDVIVRHPFADPKQFAMNWYVQYPALTILFYPPLLYILSAPAFLLFGESHAVAQAMVALHLVVLGLGMVALARFWLDRWAALAAGVILMTLPEIALWGRQVMLEIPALAWLVWSAVFCVRHARRGDTLSLLLAALFMLAALYTKISMGFVAPVLAVFLLQARGFSFLAERRVWVVLVLTVIGLLPLVTMTLLFGQANVQSVVAIADTPASRNTLAGWVWYARQLPGMVGWIPLALALSGFRESLADRTGRFRPGERMLFVLWVVVCYLALSFIELKEARHATILLVPVALWAAMGLAWFAQLIPAARAVLPVAAALGLAAFSLLAQPVPREEGYREAVERAAAAAPKDSVVLFSGKRDGSFVFNMRTVSGRPDLYTVRADKLLLTIAVRRELGVGERGLAEADIVERIRALGVSVVVAERDFWLDIPQMARFQAALDGPDFQEIGRVGIGTDGGAGRGELRLYRVAGDLRPRPRDLSVDLPIIGRSIEGEVR